MLVVCVSLPFQAPTYSGQQERLNNIIVGLSQETLACISCNFECLLVASMSFVIFIYTGPGNPRQAIKKR